MSAKIKIMTVKIQRSLFGSPPKVLIYNKDRSYFREFPLDKTFRAIMGESVKSYFKVKIENGKLSVIEPVYGLDW